MSKREGYINHPLDLVGTRDGYINHPNDNRWLCPSEATHGPKTFTYENLEDEPIDEIGSIRKEIREAKIMWVKAHEMFQQEIDDIKKEQERIVKHLNHVTDVINKVKRAWESI